MNTTLFKTTIAALALLVTFNACKEKDEKLQFPSEDIKLLVEDGMVFTNLEDIANVDFFSGTPNGMKPYLYIGTSPDSCNYRIDIDDIKSFTRYYWYVLVRDENDYYNTAQSEARSFYYVTPPQITEIHNVEGDWAVIVKWEQSDYMKATKLTLTPNKECKYDNTPIDLSAMTDSCYISAGSEFDSKYAVYHQWWDDSKAQYYEPVIYSFKVTYSGEIDGHSFTIESEPKKYIFLDRTKYAADKQFNVYRMGRIGGRTWLLEDLRGIPADDEGYPIAIESMISDEFKVWDSIPEDIETQINSYHPILLSPLGFKARCYCANVEIRNVIPEGFHLATDDDWQDLEYTYGVAKTDYYNYPQLGVQDNGLIFGSLINYTPDWNGTNNRGRKLYDKYANDTLIYVGGKCDIFNKLISDNEWVTNDSIKTVIRGTEGFNARPYGMISDLNDGPYRIGYSVAFMTSTNTKDSNNERRRIIRLLWSPNHGIGRINLAGYSDNNYMLRCVKNE